MTTRGRRELGSYTEITAEFQAEVMSVLRGPPKMTRKELAKKIGVDGSSITLLLKPERVGTTSRIVRKVADALGIPIVLRPPKDVDNTHRKLLRLKAVKPDSFRVVDDLIDKLIDKIEN